MYLSPQYNAILFDLDDTLIDFQTAERKSLAIIYKNFYKPYVDFNNFILLFHQTNKNLWRDFEENKIALKTLGLKRFEILSQKLSANVDIRCVSDLYERSLGTISEWFLGTLEMLNLLNEKFCLGVVTNGFSKVQQIKYQKLSIASWCKCYIVSEEVGFSKPNREIFDIALHKMGYQPPEVLMVGDSISSDYKGALNTGLDFCWINQFDQELPINLPKPKYTMNSVTALMPILNSL